MVYICVTDVYIQHYKNPSLSISPAQLGGLLRPVNVPDLLDLHGVEDVRDPGGEELEPDVVDGVVDTAAVAELAPASTGGNT